MGVKDETLCTFLDSIAASTPTPGGGSVSALVGALAAALARMVAGLARDKKGYEAVQSDLIQIESKASALQTRLLGLADEDAKAYDAVVAAMRQPKGTDAEKASRVDAMQASYQGATRVPLETMAACSEVLELAAMALEKGNRGATTDAAVAILLAEAGLRGASLNARINLASIRDEAFRASSETKMDRILSHADEVGHRAMALAEGRL
jgi:formiminotetrahydrofolate cyclodeaminase